MGNRLFTPRPVRGTDPGPFAVWEDGERRMMELDEEDSARWEQIRWTPAWVAVTDQLTGISVLVRWADCGAGCHCAAEYLTDQATMILAESLLGEVFK